LKEGSRHLREILESLVKEGALSSEQSHLVEDRYSSLAGSDSRKSIAAEIAAYLGGAFILIAMIFLAAKTWGDAPRAIRVSSLALLSLGLLIVARFLGSVNAMRLRLTSVLSMGAAISATGSIGFLTSKDGAPWAPLLVGAVISTYSFVKYQHEILHIGAYGYLFVTGLMVLGAITNVEPEDSFIYPMYWIILASIWLYASSLSLIDRTLGYLMSGATIFISLQFLFSTDHRVLTYLFALISAPLFISLFLRDRSWPLLLGAVLITTATIGEFVAATLGGSIGALLGLLAAGITLITTSLLAIRKAQHSQ
jgi:hypothetical protein